MKSRVLRWLKRIVVGALATVLGVIVVGLVFLHTDCGRNYVREKLEAQLQSTFPGGARIDRIEGSVLGTLTVSGIELRATDGQPAIQIGSADISIGIAPLFRRTVRVTKLVAQDVRVVVGGAPLTKPSEDKPTEDKPESTEPSKGGGWSIELPEIEVHGQLAVANKPYTLADLELTGGFIKPAGEAMAANVEISGTWRERDLAVHAEAQVAIGGGIVTIPLAKVMVGDARVDATALVIDPEHPTGTIIAGGSAAALAAIDPRIDLPADTEVRITATPVGGKTQLEIEGLLGDTAVHGSVHGNANAVDGYLGVGAVNIGKLTRDRVAGVGEVALIAHVDRGGLRAMIGVRGVAGIPGGAQLAATDATIVVGGTWNQLDVTTLVKAGDTRLAATASGTRGADGKIVLAKAGAVARAHDLGPLTNDRVPVTSRGELTADLALTKPVVLVKSKVPPSPKQPPPADDSVVDVKATVSGEGVAYTDVRVARVEANGGATLAGSQLAWHGTANVQGVSRAGKLLGGATVTARSRTDGKIRADVEAHPAMAQLAVGGGGVIAIGDVIDIVLDEHHVVPKVGAPWRGTTGHVVVAKDTITVEKFTTANGKGHVTIGGKLERASGALDAHVDATELPAQAIDPALAGTASGKLTIKRRGLRWDGSGTFEANDLVVSKDVPMLAGTAKLEVHDRKIALAAYAKNPAIGGVRLELDVEGPRDITDFAAWKRLERSAVHEAKVTIEHVDLAAAAGPRAKLTGKVDGSLQIGETTAAGTIAVTGVITPIGGASGNVTFAPLAGDIGATWQAQVADVGDVKVAVDVALPQRLFDPAAWKQLGQRVVRSADVSTHGILIDPTRLAKLGIATPYSGRAHVKVVIGEGGESARLAVDLRKLIGGAIVQPIDVHVEARTGETQTSACAYVVRAQPSKLPQLDPTADCPTQTAKLVSLDNVVSPIALGDWVAHPIESLDRQLGGQLTIPKQTAASVLAVFGRTDIDDKRGDVSGTITLSGSLKKPAASVAIAANHIAVAHTLTGARPAELATVNLKGMWDGAGGDLALVAVGEGALGTIQASAKGRVARPDEVEFRLETLGGKPVDVAPLVAFLPFDLAATTGKLNGIVTLTGTDWTKARGGLFLTKASLPIAPIVGTLRDATAKLFLDVKGIHLDAEGTLNACRNPQLPKCAKNMTLVVSAPNDGSTITADLDIDHISPLAEIEPLITGHIHSELTRSGRELHGTIDVRNAAVSVPEKKYSDLLAIDLPKDVYFVEQPIKKKVYEAEPSAKPWLFASIRVQPTDVTVRQKLGIVVGKISASDLTLEYGAGVSLWGDITVDRLVGTFVGRDYTMPPDSTLATFHGDLDPDVAIDLSHTFTSGTTVTVSVHGRPSDAKFPAVHFSDDQGRFTESQNAAFVAGADPGGDVNTQTADLGKQLGSALVSEEVAKRLKRVLPKQLTLDVIKCEAGTSASGASCTFGKRFLHDELYIAYKRRLAALPTENADEAQMQYYLSKEWYFEGEGGSANIIGADLLWRRRW